MSFLSTPSSRRPISGGRSSVFVSPGIRFIAWSLGALALIVSGARAQQPITGAPQVVAGAATFTQSGNTRTVTQQSGAAIINWNDLSINAGDLLRFAQPGADSAVLNRVLGGQPSLLNGQLQANGSVYLINPKGVMVGPQGRIDVGAFFASTLDVSDDDFLRRRALRFAGDSQAGVQNLGRITASEGDVMLIAYTVRNSGSIEAAKGVAGLAAGSEVFYTHQGDQRIAVQSGLSASGLENGVENTGLVQAAQAELKAAGGNIYSLAVNQAGVVRATGVETKNGRVLLVADGGDVKVSGEISAQNANGSGGQILVGGGFQGKDSTVANAANTVVTASAKLDASATGTAGDGGEVIVWADRATQFAGHVAARGGRTSGNGGFVEVSGKRWLNFTGTADTTATNGKRGTLLLDPDAIIISTAANQDVVGQGGFFQAQAVPSYLNNALLNDILAMSDVEIRTGDSVSGPAGFNGISVNADLTWSASTNLKLVSGDTIAINANINGGSNGTLTLMPGTVNPGESTTGAITLASGNSITVNTLTIEKSTLASTNGANIGAINLAGTVNAATVNLVRASGGVEGDVLINNAANQIGTLRGTDSAGAISGALRVTDSTGGLTVAGDLSSVGGAVEIVATGNLTLASDALVKNTGTSDLVLASRSGNFINNAGATAVEASGAGRYLIYSDLPAGTTRGGLTGANTYNKTYAANAPASITATGDRFLFNFAPSLTLTLDDVSRAYGAANPTFTYTLSGLQAGDTVSSAGLTGAPAVTSTATATTGVGTATISATVGTLQSEAGYGFSFAPGTMTITRAPLTITADNLTRLYGAANPTFTASYSGLVNSDTSAVVSGLTFGTAATPSSGVGSYAITLSGGTAANYALTLASGTLTVNPASLVVTANDFSRLYGAANPTFTAGYAGLVNGDTAAVLSGLTLTTSATVTSGVGAYAINAAGATAPNYSLTFAPGTLTINPAPLTVAINHASRLFGASNPSFSALFNGLVNGENTSVVTGLTLGTTADTSSNVGDFAITGSGATAANYAISYQPGTLTISNAPLTIAANDASRTYGAANPTFTANYTGLTAGNTSSVVTGLQFNTTATLTSGVGNYTITPFGATAPNYGITYNSGSLSITPAALTIRANDTARTYGAANPTFAGTFTGLVAGDTASSISGVQFTTTATAATGIGNYTITTSGATNPNYTITQQAGTLTIDRAALIITANDLTRTYGAANPTFTASYSGFVNSENSSVVSGLTLATTAATNSSVGNYAITASGATAANYSITLNPGQLTINPALLTITANDFSRVYGAANPAFTASYAGLVAGDTASIVSGLQLATAATSATDVGSYAINASSAAAPNYTINYAPGNLAITPAALTVDIDDASRAYGAANPTFTAGFTGFVNGDTAAVVSGLTLGTTATTGSNVGSYAINGSGATAANYAISYEPGALTITPAPLTIKANDASRLFGVANPTFTALYTGLVNGDNSSVVTGLSLTTLADLNSAAGSYAITAAGASATNYAITYQTGLLTISNALLTITANDFSRVYGAANPTFTASYSGFTGGDDASVVTGLQFSTAATLNSGVGTYTITPFGATATNYGINYVPGSLSITPAALTIRANDTARTYGAANPAFAGTFTGLVAGDTASSISGVQFTTTATAATGIGNYTISTSGATNPNYTITQQPGTLTINPAALIITANDLTRTYGAANPTLTASYSGFVNSENSSVVSGLTLATTAATNSSVGNYAITASGATAANYSITLNPGQLTINPALLTITANDFSRVYGAANPAFTASYAGFVAGDTASIVSGLQLATAATSATGVGNYAINASSATAPNYTINYAPGTLAITPAALTIRPDDASRLYGAANPTFTAGFTGLVNGDTSAVVSGLTLGTTATQLSNVGSYAITAAGATSANYAINYAAGALTVNQAPLTITAGNASRLFGASNPSFTAQFAGLLNGDSSSVVTGLSLATTADSTTSVGDYAITASGGSATNYALSYNPGTLTITRAPLTITANDFTRTYGATNPTFTASFTGLTGGNTSAVVSGLQFNTVATTVSGVGNYTVTPFGATAANYTISYQTGSLAITPAALTIRANDTARTYGASNPTFTSTFTGLVAGDTAANISGLQLTTSASAVSGVGSYSINASGATNPNYTITHQPGILTINPATLTVTADSFTRTYGAAHPALTATYSGFVNGENFTVASGLNLATAATSASNVGTYAINASGVTAPNYAVTYVPGTATINPAALTIRADSFTRIYGEANPTFTASFSGLTNGDTTAVVSGLQLNSTATSLTGVGAYAITPSGASASNYTIAYQPGSLSIAPAFLLVRPNDAARIYGAADPAFTANITGFVNGDTASVVSGLQINSAASITSDVGTYDIVGSGATAANYQFGYTPGILTVNRAALTAIANDATRTYGAADPAFTSRFTGLLNGDTAAVVTGLTYTTPATATSGVGSYSLLPSGGTSTNYTITSYQPGALAITPASVTVTPNTATRGYGDENPTFTASFVGLMNGETNSVFTAQPTFTSPATLTSNVGNYAINATGAAAANYTFTYNPGTLAVTPAVLAVRADNLVRTYGDANPTFTYSVSGLKNGDTADGRFFIFTLGSTAAPNANVGNYTIQLTGNDTPNDNYTAFFAPGTLTVQPRALTLAANPATRQYGLANPAFSASFAGLASFDSSSVITNVGFNTAATPATGVGTVGVVPTSSPNANYAITYQPGQLTITPAPLSVLAGGEVSRFYGDANPSFASFVTAGTLYNGDTLSSIGTTATTTAVPTSNVGTYAITSAITSPNYTLTPVAGSLTILPAIIDVSLGAVNRIYGNADPAAVPASITGLKFGEDAASLLTFNFSSTTSSPVGAYAVGASATSANYQLRSLTPGTVNVLPRQVTVTIDNTSRTYGDINPAFTARVGGLGLAAGDTVAALLGSSVATTLATQASNVGTYALNAQIVANPNYAATYVNGSLLVTSRPITLTGLDLTRLYYDSNPSSFYTIGGAGLASFDTLSAVLTAPGVLPAQTANVGAYTVNTPQLSGNPNYAVSVARLPTLTVAPRPVTLAVNSLSLGLGETVPPFSVTTTNFPAIKDVATEFPGLTFSTGPVPVLPGTFSFGDTITVAGVTTTRLQVTASGFANPNYAVTATPGLLTTTVAVDETARPGGMLVVSDKKPLVVETFDVTAPVKLAAPLSDPYYRPVLAAGVNYIFDEIRDGNLKFKRALSDAGLPIDLEGGVEAFLADIATNSVKQALLTGALASLVTEEVLKEPSARSSVLAPLVATTMEAARKAKLAQETEAVAKYDAWLAAERAGPASLDVMMTGGDNVPNFLGEARAAHNAIAVVSVVGAGAGSFVVMSTLTAAIPATVATFGSTASGAVGSILFGATSAASGASSTAGLAAGPVGAAVVVVTGSIMRGLDIKKSEDNRRDLEQARVSVNSGVLPAIDLNDKEDLATFGSAFYGVVGLTGFGGG